MKLFTTKTFLYRFNAKKCWHRWFAWYPVKIKTYPDGASIIAWLTEVERKNVNYGGVIYVYHYRCIGDD